MAPVSTEIISSGLNFHNWSSSAVNISGQAAEAASKIPEVSGVWTWFVGIFAVIWSFLVARWGDVCGWVSYLWASFSEFLVRPHICTILIVWIIVFWTCFLILLVLGFESSGVWTGNSDPQNSFRCRHIETIVSLVALSQWWACGAFTPAGRFTAVLTSVALLVTLYERAGGRAVIYAYIAAGITWYITGHT